MDTIMGPGSPFALLFDDGPSTGIGLPPSFQQIYAGDWRIPDGQPYVYSNFAVSRDGRVSFDEPGHSGGGDVSGFNPHDRWLMGLLRARADAVLVGDTTLRVEPEHLWTAAYIFPDDAASFAALRTAERRSAAPLQVFLSQTGDLPWDAAVFNQPELTIVIATTTSGAARVGRTAPTGQQIDALALGETSADLAALVQVLRQRYGVQTLLCEGGPRVYGAMLAAGQVDDEFVTLCPVLIGNRTEGHARAGLVEGVAFAPGAAPHPRPVSLRRAGDHLFLRSCLR